MTVDATERKQKMQLKVVHCKLQGGLEFE